MAKTIDNQQEEQGFWGKLFTGDRALWIIIALMMVFSILVVYSSTAKMVYQGASDTGTYSYMFKQIFFVMLGLGVILMVHKIDYDKYRTWAWVVYGGAVHRERCHVRRRRPAGKAAAAPLDGPVIHSGGVSIESFAVSDPGASSLHPLLLCGGTIQAASPDRRRARASDRLPAAVCCHP